MEEVKINGKTYKVNISYGSFKKASQKTDGFSKPEAIIDALWIFLKPVFFWFKPFLLKRRMVNKISFKEIREIDEAIAEEFKVLRPGSGN